ncbi:hypothetical protein CWI36_3283p0010 [Hamiltosporidium magnivora]|uniref:Uncharacterized protein n=1 Tax=Hamiltosporidium magnivora TaxID=148818 RepID=A0A4Q9KQT6_9MICR|nr:hypothetical protein CWI36_3283p0010 [Hamiltosporidium magnivora]
MSYYPLNISYILHLFNLLLLIKITLYMSYYPLNISYILHLFNLLLLIKITLYMSHNHLKDEEDNLSNKDISISLDNLGQKYSGLKPIKKPTIGELPLPDICNFISVFEEDESKNE